MDKRSAHGKVLYNDALGHFSIIFCTKNKNICLTNHPCHVWIFLALHTHVHPYQTKNQLDSQVMRLISSLSDKVKHVAFLSLFHPKTQTHPLVRQPSYALTDLPVSGRQDLYLSKNQLWVEVNHNISSPSDKVKRGVFCTFFDHFLTKMQYITPY